MEGASDVDMLLAQVDDLSLLLPDDLQSAAPSAGPPAGSAMAEGKHRRTLHRQQGAHDTALESFGLEVNAAGRVTAAAQESGVALGSRVIEVNHEYVKGREQLEAKLAGAGAEAEVVFLVQHTGKVNTYELEAPELAVLDDPDEGAPDDYSEDILRRRNEEQRRQEEERRREEEKREEEEDDEEDEEEDQEDDEEEDDVDDDDDDDARAGSGESSEEPDDDDDDTLAEEKTYYTDALYFAKDLADKISNPVSALSAFCETLTAVDLRTAASSAVTTIGKLNQPTAETLQLLVIDEIQGALRDIKKARRSQDPSELLSVAERQERHAAGTLAEPFELEFGPEMVLFDGARRADSNGRTSAIH